MSEKRYLVESKEPIDGYELPEDTSSLKNYTTQEIPPNARLLTREQVKDLLMRVEQAQDFKGDEYKTCNADELLDELFGPEQT